MTSVGAMQFSSEVHLVNASTSEYFLTVSCLFRDHK
jgi:hypothetical protein